MLEHCPPQSAEVIIRSIAGPALEFALCEVEVPGAQMYYGGCQDWHCVVLHGRLRSNATKCIEPEPRSTCEASGPCSLRLAPGQGQHLRVKPSSQGQAFSVSHAAVQGWTIHGRVVLIFPPGEAGRAKPGAMLFVERLFEPFGCRSLT